MKVKRFLIPLLILICCVFAFSACDNNASEDPLIPISITDFEGYANMTREGTDSITVHYDNDSSKYFIFTIEDETEISAVMDLIFSANFTDGGTDPVPPGNNTHFVIKQGEAEYGISVRGVMRGDNHYYFNFPDSAVTLSSKLYELAVSAGAYEAE